MRNSAENICKKGENLENKREREGKKQQGRFNGFEQREIDAGELNS